MRSMKTQEDQSDDFCKIAGYSTMNTEWQKPQKRGWELPPSQRYSRGNIVSAAEKPRDRIEPHNVVEGNIEHENEQNQ
jgi:hypothetical protein